MHLLACAFQSPYHCQVGRPLPKILPPAPFASAGFCCAPAPKKPSAPKGFGIGLQMEVQENGRGEGRRRRKERAGEESGAARESTQKCRPLHAQANATFLVTFCRSMVPPSRKGLSILGSWRHGRAFGSEKRWHRQELLKDRAFESYPAHSASIPSVSTGE